ncbi:MAG: CPBP family intramembrane metalloprotease [Elusimicrobiota bacterium]|nr:CPBP family intramembrane metalloprotease [Elusimicrobiota bacterium]
MKLNKETSLGNVGGACPSHKKYYAALLLILLFNQFFYLFTGGMHTYIFNYFLSNNCDKYTLDFTITVVKNILIINWQILLILGGLRVYNLSVQDIGWRGTKNISKIIVGVVIIILYRLLKKTLFGNAGGIGIPSIALSGFWEALNNPVVYYHLIIVPFVSPLFEELFYRGFVFTVLEKRVGWIWAVLGSSFAFSAFHTTSIISFSMEIFIKGIIYGLLRRWDGSIWSSVAAHSANNWVASWFIIKV